MDVITATSILTTNHSVVLYQLESGNLLMVEYQISAGELLIAALLALLVVMLAVQQWRDGR